MAASLGEESLGIDSNPRPPYFPGNGALLFPSLVNNPKQGNPCGLQTRGGWFRVGRPDKAPQIPRCAKIRSSFASMAESRESTSPTSLSDLPTGLLQASSEDTTDLVGDFDSTAEEFPVAAFFIAASLFLRMISAKPPPVPPPVSAPVGRTPGTAGAANEEAVAALGELADLACCFCCKRKAALLIKLVGGRCADPSNDPKRPPSWLSRKRKRQRGHHLKLIHQRKSAAATGRCGARGACRSGLLLLLKLIHQRKSAAATPTNNPNAATTATATTRTAFGTCSSATCFLELLALGNLGQEGIRRMAMYETLTLTLRNTAAGDAVATAGAEFATGAAGGRPQGLSHDVTLVSEL
eukprot:CAMPEP_0172647604 /NCGR_PEP_ID=MMETSP1068-20121228/240835_1 /TAXON_ID=35684 /ORGANISM="Pseudopedinella elastica, Strain CCMP716" /LENGTH=352 /DNA_ID=CAMNT_0013461885 /DNA_START=10 /DNA_END=1070 /DNA_ORIENTATION=+